MNKLLLAIVLSSATAAVAAPADSTGLALAAQKNCLSCHAVAKKFVGPSFKEVANKYANSSGAPQKLATKVLKGGGGVWGPVPMPANLQASPEEVKSLVAWVLSGARD